MGLLTAAAAFASGYTIGRPDGRQKLRELTAALGDTPATREAPVTPVSRPPAVPPVPPATRL